MGEALNGTWGKPVPVRRFGSEGLEPIGRCGIRPPLRGAFCRSGNGGMRCWGFGGETEVGGQLCVSCTWPEKKG